jgi:hypothetical protein
LVKMKGKRKPATAREQSPPAETQFIPDDGAQMWEAICILDEIGPRGGAGKYLIKWAGTDPATGEAWDPSWEPKGGASQDLIQEWKEKKEEDPTIVGKEGARLQAMMKSRATKKKQVQDKKKKRTAEGPVAKMKRKRAELGVLDFGAHLVSFSHMKELSL